MRKKPAQTLARSRKPTRAKGSDVRRRLAAGQQGKAPKTKVERSARRERVARERGGTWIYDQNSDAIRALLGSRSVAEVARGARLQRRKIERLLGTKPPKKIRADDLAKLAKFFKRDVSALRKSLVWTGPTQTVAEHLAGLLADDIQLASVDRANLVAVLAGVMWLDNWSSAVLEGGTPLLDDGLPIEENANAIESRRARFARHVADGLRVLLEPLADEGDAERRLNVAAIRRFLQLGSDIASAEHQRANPLSEAIAEKAVRRSHRKARRRESRRALATSKANKYQAP